VQDQFHVTKILPTPNRYETGWGQALSYNFITEKNLSVFLHVENDMLTVTELKAFNVLYERELT